MSIIGIQSAILCEIFIQLVLIILGVLQENRMDVSFRTQCMSHSAHRVVL